MLGSGEGPKLNRLVGRPTLASGKVRECGDAVADVVVSLAEDCEVDVRAGLVQLHKRHLTKTHSNESRHCNFPHEPPAPNLLHGLLEVAHHVIIVGRNKHELHFVLLDGFLELRKNSPFTICRVLPRLEHVHVSSVCGAPA